MENKPGALLTIGSISSLSKWSKSDLFILILLVIALICLNIFSVCATSNISLCNGSFGSLETIGAASLAGCSSGGVNTFGCDDLFLNSFNCVFLAGIIALRASVIVLKSPMGIH